MPHVAPGNVAVIHGITVTLSIVSFNCLTAVIFQKISLMQCYYHMLVLKTVTNCEWFLIRMCNN